MALESFMVRVSLPVDADYKTAAKVAIEPSGFRMALDDRTSSLRRCTEILAWEPPHLYWDLRAQITKTLAG